MDNLFIELGDVKDLIVETAWSVSSTIVLDSATIFCTSLAYFLNFLPNITAIITIIGSVHNMKTVNLGEVIDKRVIPPIMIII